MKYITEEKIKSFENEKIKITKYIEEDKQVDIRGYYQLNDKEIPFYLSVHLNVVGDMNFSWITIFGKIESTKKEIKKAFEPLIDFLKEQCEIIKKEDNYKEIHYYYKFVNLRLESFLDSLFTITALTVLFLLFTSFITVPITFYFIFHSWIYVLIGSLLGVSLSLLGQGTLKYTSS